ncbi:perilipin-3-like isoform X3 [Sceloporus undulatus]|uniref:perilipin-3-like isoform X3 n=1 Tax=Sceloporus undulatus TaxID=8520 RepID=UPI001C4C5653|nr:perilipin-3-like isoform X3 [Sceloporus undulatus]
MSSEESSDASHTAPESKEAEQQNAISRVASLPLVSSTYDMVSSAYASTKETHPYLKSVCNVAEMGVKTLTAAAVSGAQPLLTKLEPQIATANEYACKGLDKLEEKLPILQQPSEKVVADTKELVSTRVTGAQGIVASTVNGARDAVTGVVGIAKGAVQGSMEVTRSVVAGGMNTVLGSRMGQMVATGVDALLGKSEELVDHYLPMTDQELATLATSVEGFDMATVEQQKAQGSYFVRLGSLSAKLRHRAYQHSLAKLKDAKQGTQDALARLHQTIELVESRTLAMFRGLTQQLQLSCSTLTSRVQGLPATVQDKVQLVRSTVEDLHSSFSGVRSFQEMPAGLLVQSRERIAHARGSIDEMLDYVVQNVPLPWVVGPFAPNLVELPDVPSSDAEKTEDGLQSQEEPKEKTDIPKAEPSSPKAEP